MPVVDLAMTAPQREYLHYLLDDEYFDQIGFDGPRGINKTFACCVGAVLRRFKYPHTKGGIIRKTAKAAESSVKKQLLKVHRLLKVDARYSAAKGFYYPAVDGHLDFLHCNHDADFENIQGDEYSDMLFEEATQHSFYAWGKMAGSLRTDFAGCAPKLCANANPGNARGQGWYKRIFVNPATRDDRTHRITADRWDALPTIENDPGYYRRLGRNLDEVSSAQWLGGDWEAQAGTYFWFNPDEVFKRMDIPPYARWYSGHDWGYYPDPYAVVWVAKWQDNRGYDHLHVQREYGGWRMDPDVQARKTLEVEEKLHRDGFMQVKTLKRFADHQAWRRETAKNSKEVGRTVASLWSKEGMNCLKAYTRDRLPGWTRLRMAISRKVLTIDPGCLQLREEMDDAVNEGADSGTHGPDIDEDCADHYLSALRFVLVSASDGKFRGPETDDYELYRQTGIYAPRTRAVGVMA